MTQDPVMLEDPGLRADIHRSLLVPRMSAFEAIRRHWLTALLPFVAFVAAAVVLAAARAPVYTAEARLAIAGVDLSSPGALSGFASASESLASTYSRSVTAQPVVEQVAQKVGASPTEVLADLSATPVPLSPVFRVIATTNSASLAPEMANAAAVALQDYIQTLNAGAQRGGKRFYDEYRQAAGTVQSLQVDQQNASSDYAQHKTAANARELAKTRADLSTAQLGLQGLEQNYLATTGGRVDIATVQQINTAADASSDRRSHFLIFVLIGAVAGALAGVAVATLRGNRALRRHFTS